MELINKKGKVAIFNADNTLVTINKDLKKWKSLLKEEDERLHNPNFLVLPSPNDLDEITDEEGYDSDMDAKITNIYDIFRMEYGDTAAQLNISVKKALLAEMRTLHSRTLYDETTSREERMAQELSFMEKMIRSILGKEKADENEDVELSIEDISRMFDVVKVRLGDERKYADRILPIIRAMQKAEQFGQVSRKERLFRDLLVNKYESILFSAGFCRFIDEDELVGLEKSINATRKKSLDICFVENYTKSIPDEIGDRMMEAEMLEVFDNYAVLYYSDRTVDEPTNEEKRKIDPILFGVINGINRLYYIGDWIDGDDDLTWAVVEENISDKSRIELNRDINLNF